ncbi:amino acid transporter [Auriscalpium vulgare]|uniref:Amino acid transporter n=1 Tax=Auriscalpium vulgare TaxID=40419 RepID=A0ACB8RVD8_9AGAM|nr:amino acid transporter [Auriscalpium vulgare]
MSSFFQAFGRREVSSPSSDEGYEDEKVAVGGEKGEAVDVVQGLAKQSETVRGGLTFEEDTAGGMGRHLGVFSCTLLIIGRIIGTGIFSTPASILGSVGSVGASLMLWVLGFVLSFCGLFIWLEYGTMFPRSGGEKVYLEAVYKKPKYLVTVIFAANAIILGFTASGCLVFAQNILISAGHAADRWVVRGIALGVIFFVTLLHGLTPRLGIYLMNALSLFKIFILVFIVITGWVVLAGGTRVEHPHANFHDAFAGSSHHSSDYATATFKVLNAYAGWSNVNYVLNDVKNPVRTLKIAGPLGLGITSVLYLLANIAYFSAASKQEILKSGVTVASLFFKNVFGTQAQKALTVFVALSALGTLSLSHLQPLGSIKSLPRRVSHYLSAIAFGRRTGPLVIVIIAPPPKVAYPFILDVEGYPQQIINFFIVIGLFYLRWAKPGIKRPFKVWWPIAVFFLAAAVFLLVNPFLRPANKVGDTPPLPYYLYCLIGIAIMFIGVAYWAAWRVVLPRFFGYKLVPRKEKLEDGTVVTLFSRQKVE